MQQRQRAPEPMGLGTAREEELGSVECPSGHAPVDVEDGLVDLPLRPAVLSACNGSSVRDHVREG